MKEYKRVLTIAGSDSGGCAGVQADIKTITSLGCYASSAITALTAQNTVGVKSVMSVDSDFLAEQIDAVLSDIGTDSIKIGMLADAKLVKVVAGMLERYKVQNVVVDPVLVATSGDSLSSNGVAEAIVEYLFPLATIITPNRFEAERFSGEKDDEAIVEKLSDLGAGAVLLKGGHTPNGTEISDKLYIGDVEWEFTHQMVDTKNTHGTGCSLSSAIASFLAKGEELRSAVKNAIAWEVSAIEGGADYHLGHGHGPLDHFWAYRDK